MAISQNVPATRSRRGPLREWMKIAVAQAVCRLGMQLRGVTVSKGMECGADIGGGISGHRFATAQCPSLGIWGDHRAMDAQWSVPVP